MSLLGTERVKRTDVSCVRVRALLVSFHRLNPNVRLPVVPRGVKEVCPLPLPNQNSHFTIWTNTKWTNTFYTEKYILQFRGEQIWRRCALLHRPIKTELCRGRRRIRSIVQNAFTSLSKFLNLPLVCPTLKAHI